MSTENEDSFADEDDFDYDGWLESRPSITQERNHPNHWYNRAADLHASAGGLWHVMYQADEKDVASRLGFTPDHSMAIACRPVYHMMCGLALEVIMKAVLIQRGVPFPKKHDLDKLVTLLGLVKTPDELMLLKFYENSIYWAGKYPTPNRCTDDKLKDYWSLASDVLTSPMELGKEYGLKFRQGNDADDWSKFSILWKEYSSLFNH